MILQSQLKSFKVFRNDKDYRWFASSNMGKWLDIHQFHAVASNKNLLVF